MILFSAVRSNIEFWDGCDISFVETLTNTMSSKTELRRMQIVAYTKTGIENFIDRGSKSLMLSVSDAVRSMKSINLGGRTFQNAKSKKSVHSRANFRFFDSV